MPLMWDALKIAEAPKEKALRVRECPRETTCVLCGGPLSPLEWYVALGSGAHPNCAADHGWEVR